MSASQAASTCWCDCEATPEASTNGCLCRSTNPIGHFYNGACNMLGLGQLHLAGGVK